MLYLFPIGHRVLVCGGREFTDREYVFEKLDYLRKMHGFDLVIHGAARGADSLAGEWATERGIRVLVFPVTKAEWDQYPGRAGHRRNQRMINEGLPTLGVAFPGEGGTADMVRRLERKRIHTYRF